MQLEQEKSSAYLFSHLEVNGAFTELEERSDYHTRITILIDSQSSGGVLARKHSNYILITDYRTYMKRKSMPT